MNRFFSFQVSSPSSSPAVGSPTSSKPSPALLFFLGGIILLLIVLILITVFQKRIKSTNLRGSQLPVAKDVLSGSLRTIIYFNFRTLRKATKNFNQTNLLGRGGFGPVYLGKLGDGRLVAVKKLAVDRSQQGEAEFIAEVKMITSIQHKNLVRLLGCCSDRAQRLLVYEYMKNRSLDHIIYGKNEINLSWATRFQIILGIARGLQYLHEDSHVRIVHRDIKASNILLDEKFHPRIGDFGLARFFPEDQAYLSTTLAGTLGYTAPEYALRGELSEKADIYSFGVLVLEIVCSRRNTDLDLPSGMQYLPEYAWKLYERSRLVDLIDPRMREDGFNEKDILLTIHVAFLCLQPLAKQRPPMSDIVAMLTCKVEMYTAPARPTFLERKKSHGAKISWDSVSGPHPSLISDSSSSAIAI